MLICLWFLVLATVHATETGEQEFSFNEASLSETESCVQGICHEKVIVFATKKNKLFCVNVFSAVLFHDHFL